MRRLYGPLVLIGLVMGGASASEAATISTIEAAFGPGSTLVTFSEVPLGTNADGLTIGNSTFFWHGVGSITVANGGPGNTNNIVQPSLLSVSSVGVLEVDFSNYINMMGYGYAILANSVVPNATNITLFDNAVLVGMMSFTGTPDPGFSGGFAGVLSDVAFNRVQLTFSGDAFDLDELRTAAAVPEPTSMLLLGTGIAGVMVRARRRKTQHQ